jgi:S-phase kinase-associated protein 1
MMLLLRTNDNHVVHVEDKDMGVSHLISTILPSLDVENPEEIPLFNVSYPVLLKIVEYTRHYRREPMKSIPKPLVQNRLGVQQWYVDYITSLQEPTLYELLNAATYLDILPLQELICARIASLITGKECHELKEIFGFNYE